GEDRRPVGRILVGGVVDLEVVDGEAGCLESVDNALGPLTAAGLGLEAPHERAIAGLEAATLDRLVGERRARIMQDCADISETGGGIRRLGLLELRVHDV